MATVKKGLIDAGPLTDLQRQGCTVVTGAGHTIAVFVHGGNVYALDNRCPHMGFPLAQGTVREGMLTCHWHHARFDLASGNTFDLFAGDIPAFATRVEDGRVYVDPAPPLDDPGTTWGRRLDEALEHNIRLVVERSVIGMMGAGAGYRAPLAKGADFGVRNNGRGWSACMRILSACANMQPWLTEDDQALAMYQGLFHVAEATEGQPPRFPIEPLGEGVTDPALLKSWFRRFIGVRDNEAVERTLRSAIDAGLSREAVSDIVFSAVTDHLFVDGGHTLDFANKAFELLDHVGWEQAPLVLTSLVPQMTTASRSEESSAWRHPVDVASMIFEAWEEPSALIERGRDAEAWQGAAALVGTMLEDDPGATIDALKAAIAGGATPGQLGGALTYAAFLRMARYHHSNEFADWNTVHHCVTTANALHQALLRAPSDDLLRGVFDTAMSIYHARFLNVPPAQLPPARDRNGDNQGLAEMLSGLLDLMDHQQEVTPAARQVARYLDEGAQDDDLLATLAHAMLREDAGFHQFQLVEAALQEYSLRRGTPEGRVVLVAGARFLAAHTPTVRAAGQTYHTAFRLHRGDQVFQDDE